MECPYHANAAASDDEAMAWSLFKDNAWRVQTAGLGGLTGFDLSIATRRLAAGGLDLDVAEDLLAVCAASTIAAVNEKDDLDGGEN